MKKIKLLGTFIALGCGAEAKITATKCTILVKKCPAMMVQRKSCYTNSYDPRLHSDRLSHAVYTKIREAIQSSMPFERLMEQYTDNENFGKDYWIKTLLTEYPKTDYSRNTPVHDAAFFYKKETEQPSSNVNACRWFLNRGFSVHAVNAYGLTPLHLAATDECAHILIENNAQIEVRDRFGRTPLHCGVTYGRLGVVHALFAAHADPNPKDKDGKTPLHSAAHPEIVRVLLEKGADVHAKDNNNAKPLHHLASYGSRRFSQMLPLLLKAGNDINEKGPHGTTLLRLFLEREELENAQFLIDNGAHVEQMDKCLYELLSMRAHYHHREKKLMESIALLKKAEENQRKYS